MRLACSDPATSAADDDEASVYGCVKTSLAFVITNDGSTGSAFCVASGATASFYATSAHLTQGSPTVLLYHQRPRYEKFAATVVAEGDKDAADLAILRVDSASAPPLKLAEKSPKDESQVALAGYARVQLWAAKQFGELIPSIRFGTVTSVINGGNLVLHDVVCRPGDSGGPLFDPRSGDVLGVQKGGWQEEEEGYAIGAPVLATFLKAHNVAT